jgi:hypothetical protein
MGIWKLERRGTVAELVYKNATNGEKWSCGQCTDVASDLIVEWIVRHGDVMTAGDWYVEKDGLVMRFVRDEGRAKRHDEGALLPVSPGRN